MTFLETIADWVDDSVTKAARVMMKWEDQERAALFLGLHRNRMEEIASCIEHDLEGPRSGDVVFAQCTKCPAKFKVRARKQHGW